MSHVVVTLVSESGYRLGMLSSWAWIVGRVGWHGFWLILALRWCHMKVPRLWTLVTYFIDLFPCITGYYQIIRLLVYQPNKYLKNFPLSFFNWSNVYGKHWLMVFTYAEWSSYIKHVQAVTKEGQSYNSNWKFSPKCSKRNKLSNSYSSYSSSSSMCPTPQETKTCLSPPTTILGFCCFLQQNVGAYSRVLEWPHLQLDDLQIVPGATLLSSSTNS
jgi:hypothetical protein